MKFIFNCLKGIAIGAGAILPGISSGVLCVIFGIYEKLLDSVLNFFQDVKKNFLFLLPILIGVFGGVVLFGNLLNYFFYGYPLQIKSIFIGLILGSIPSLVKEANKKERFEKKNLIFFVITLSIGIGTVFLEKYLDISSLSSFNFPYLVLAGFMMSIGIIVPGVSSTITLMLLGVYSLYLNSVSILYLPVLIPMGIGVIIGSIIFMKITKYLLDHHYSKTFFSIIGFTIGSIFVLLPSIHTFLELVVCICCTILGYILMSLFEKK